MILICADNCGVAANKHILVLFFRHEFSFPFISSSSVSPNSSKRPTDVYLVRGFIEAEGKSIHSSPYNRPTLGYYSLAVISYLSKR